MFRPIIIYPRVEYSSVKVCKVMPLLATRCKSSTKALGQSELYDLASDSQALYNHYDNAAYMLIQRDLAAKLLTWLAQSRDITPFDTDLRGYK